MYTHFKKRKKELYYHNKAEFTSRLRKMISTIHLRLLQLELLQPLTEDAGLADVRGIPDMPL